ncbi:MAG: lipoyl synthase [Planctomycetota bacterium]
MSDQRQGVKEFPSWLKKLWPAQYDSRARQILESLKTNTVCRSAECPNLGECWSHGTAAFLILGRRCTRSCRFCAVRSGQGETLESLADEPTRVAHAAKQLGLKFVVITSVTRDDLPDEGAAHFARVIQSLRETCGSQLLIEALVPDFHAREDCLRAVLTARPDVFNHNIETIARLYPTVRPQADYTRSLRVLEIAKHLDSTLRIKSGLMVGLGETQDEARACIGDLRRAGCEILTIGQYLQPSKTHLHVREFIHPDVFKNYESYAMSLGFCAAACGAFVRSSYQAEQMLRGRIQL